MLVNVASVMMNIRRSLPLLCDPDRTIRSQRRRARLDSGSAPTPAEVLICPVVLQEKALVVNRSLRWFDDVEREVSRKHKSQQVCMRDTSMLQRIVAQHV